MQKVNVNGIDLAYTRHGQGTPLVLLHGYPLDGSIWSEVVPVLQDRFDLLIPDMRGFGESSREVAPHSLDDYASDIAGLLDHLNIKKTALAGHSMGGYVALAFARLYAERVSGLGLIASQAAADTPERKQGRYETAAQINEKGISVVVEAVTPKLTSDERLRPLVQSIIEQQHPRGLSDAMRAMAERMNSSAMLYTFRFPVVIIHGDEDQLIPIERAREVKNAVAHSRFVELKGAGHMPMLEFPEETAKALSYLG
jgi:3-oxoadipate enol-lactonase